MPTSGHSRVRARAACTGLHIGRVDEVELEDHHQVGEGRQAGHRVLSELRSVDADDGLDAAPIVVDGFGAAADDDSDGFKRDHDRQS